MTEFDETKFEEKYVHYFEELQEAYSNAYNQLHGRVDSRILQGVDRRILAESEPVYAGAGQFRVVLPDDTDERIAALPGDETAIRDVLDALTDGITSELRRIFEFEQ